MNPTCDNHKEPFETIEVTETFSRKATEIRSEKFKPLHQSQTPYSSGVFAWKYICPSRVFNLFLFETCAVSPPWHPNVYFLHQVDKGY